MGNTLNLHNDKPKSGFYGVIKTKDGKIFDNYINNFFKNYKDNESKNKITGTGTLSRKMKELAEKPYLARSCCTKNRYIPVALPFVNNNDTNIKTAYPRIEIFDFNPDDIANGGNTKYINMCKFSKDNSINIGTSDEESLGQFKSGLRNSNTASICNTFYKGRNGDFSDNMGLCNRVINMRKLSKPNNMLYQFYGNVHNNVNEYKKPDNTNTSIETNANNAYPDCNCTNSIVLRTPQKKEIDENMKFAMSQTRDKYCAEGTESGNKWVQKIDTRPVSFCINIADNIKAIASEGSKIKIQQSCKSDINPPPSVIDMDKDDDSNKKALIRENKTDWELDKCKLDVYKLNYPELIKTFKNNNQEYIDYYNKNNKNEKRNCTTIIEKNIPAPTPATTTPAPTPAPAPATPTPAPVPVKKPESATNQIKPAQVVTKATTKTYFGLSLPILIGIIVTLILLTGGGIYFLTKK